MRHPNADETVFPVPDLSCGYGITKRELFAAMVMSEILRRIEDVRPYPDFPDRRRKLAAGLAVEYADALIQALDDSTPAQNNSQEKT